jgi:hypothetical protein
MLYTGEIEEEKTKEPPHRYTTNKKQGRDLSLVAWLQQLFPYLLQM